MNFIRKISLILERYPYLITVVMLPAVVVLCFNFAVFATYVNGQLPGLVSGKGLLVLLISFMISLFIVAVFSLAIATYDERHE